MFEIIFIKIVPFFYTNNCAARPTSDCCEHWRMMWSWCCIDAPSVSCLDVGRSSLLDDSKLRHIIKPFCCPHFLFLPHGPMKSCHSLPRNWSRASSRPVSFRTLWGLLIIKVCSWHFFVCFFSGWSSEWHKKQMALISSEKFNSLLKMFPEFHGCKSHMAAFVLTKGELLFGLQLVNEWADLWFWNMWFIHFHLHLYCIYFLCQLYLWL